MSNILIESEDYLLSTTFGVQRILNELCVKKGGEVRLRRPSAIRKSDINWCDVIVSVRGKSAMSWRLARLANEKGKFHVFYMDDDFLGISNTYGRYGAGIWPKRKEAILKALTYTDCIWSANPLLGQKYAALSKCGRYICTDSAINAGSIKHGSAEEREKIRLLMYINDGSTSTFDKIIAPVLPALASKYPNRLSLTLMTLRPDVSAFSDSIDIEYVEHLPFEKFRPFLASREFDIGLAPLSDEGFSRYKYINKFIEYSIAGIPAAYSACRLYESVVRDGENGVLCENTVDGWMAGLSRLIDDVDLRAKCISGAQNELINRFSIEKVLNRLAYDCPELIGFSAPQTSAFWMFQAIRLHSYIFTLGECIFFARWSLKNGGIVMLIKRTYRYFRRLIKSKREFVAHEESNAKSKHHDKEAGL